MTPELQAKLAKLKAVAEAANKSDLSVDEGVKFVCTFNSERVLALLAALETMAEALKRVQREEHDFRCSKGMCNYICNRTSDALVKLEEILNGI